MFTPYVHARIPGKLIRLACVAALGLSVALATTLGEALLIAAVR